MTINPINLEQFFQRIRQTVDAVYDTETGPLEDTSDAMGVLVCVACGHYYHDKNVALNKDTHNSQDAVWMKRYHFMGRGFHDPIVADYLPDDMDPGDLVRGDGRHGRY